MKEYYVTLTGAINNSGDFLIRKRAHGLLRKFRPDREIVDLPRWEPLDEERLATVNGAKALLLTGGPAVQPGMYPRIYPLVEDLGRIRVPISLFGVGWKGDESGFASALAYSARVGSGPLIERIEADGLPSSVRDYDTLRVLRNLGLSRVIMTGCPALHRSEGEPECRARVPVRTIAFSVGVRFIKNPSLERQMKSVVTALRKEYGKNSVTAVFQHSLGRGRSADRNRAFCSWLESEGVEYRDVSGSAEAMIDLYDHCDAHVGYRVHSHLCALSLGLTSVLLCEDGRGKSLVPLLGAGILPAYAPTLDTRFLRVDIRGPRRKVFPDIERWVLEELRSEERVYPAIRAGAEEARDRFLVTQSEYLRNLP